VSQDGFVSFFHQRFAKTVVVLITMGASRADAEDAVQEAMIAAWKNWESIREPSAWVRTTALRTLWKHHHLVLQAVPLEQPTLPPGGEPDLLIFADEQRRVLSFLRRLPVAQRTVAALYYDGLTVQEIAEVTGKPAATIRSLLRYARRSIKEVISSH
jgi:RNA polymerase sigma factor (sigma-70 family)